MSTQHPIDLNLADGRHVTGFVVLTHEIVKGDRNTRFSHGWLAVDGAEPQHFGASTRVLTNLNGDMPDKKLVNDWMEARLLEMGK